MLAGFRDERASILEPNQIYRVYASGGKVYAEADGEPYLLRMRLYEAERRLAGRSFVRISNGEIVNLKKVRGFDLSFAEPSVFLSQTERFLMFPGGTFQKSNNYWDCEAVKVKKENYTARAVRITHRNCHWICNNSDYFCLRWGRIFFLSCRAGAHRRNGKRTECGHFADRTVRNYGCRLCGGVGYLGA